MPQEFVLVKKVKVMLKRSFSMDYAHCQHSKHLLSKYASTVISYIYLVFCPCQSVLIKYHNFLTMMRRIIGQQSSQHHIASGDSVYCFARSRRTLGEWHASVFYSRPLPEKTLAHLRRADCMVAPQKNCNGLFFSSSCNIYDAEENCFQ